MAAPTIVKKIAPRTNMYTLTLAVRTSDGDIQDLTTYDGENIDDGSFLLVCSDDWLSVLTLYVRIASIWSFYYQTTLP